MLRLYSDAAPTSKKIMDLFSNKPLGQESYRGDKLKVARMAKGFSLEDIASAIGKTRQSISLYEKGMQPTEEALDAICALLSIERNFLFSQRAYPIEAEVCHFRSLRSRTQTMTKSVMARAEIFEEVVRSVEREIVFPDVLMPDVSAFNINNVNDIERAAELCRREWELGLGPISSMVNLVEKLGVVVTAIRGVDEKVDAFSVPHQRPFIIRNDAKKSVCRFRFDIAHELGHLVLHDGITTGDTITEGQANRFASAFLMPRASFSKEFPALRGRQFDWSKLVEFKLRWKVSLKAIIYRASSLGLITPEKARSGFLFLNTKGYTKEEPGDEQISAEKPTLLNRAIEVLPHREWLTILASIGVTEEIIHELFGIKHLGATKNPLRLVV